MDFKTKRIAKIEEKIREALRKDQQSLALTFRTWKWNNINKTMDHIHSCFSNRVSYQAISTIVMFI